MEIVQESSDVKRLTTEVTTSRDPARRKQLDRLIARTLAGEFAKPVQVEITSESEASHAAD